MMEGVDIYHTAVHPDYRKQGIAKQLVDAALDELSALGIKRWHWLCLNVMKRGMRFGRDRDLP